MEHDSHPNAARSAWPWWMDPYSDNPVAFGVLFALLIASMIGGLLLYRYLFITNPGANPVQAPYTVLRGMVAELARRASA